MPSRSISASTRFPNGLSPVFGSSAVDPPIELEDDHASVRERTPRSAKALRCAICSSSVPGRSMCPPSTPMSMETMPLAGALITA